VRLSVVNSLTFIPPNSTPVSVTNSYMLLSMTELFVTFMVLILSYSLYAKDKYAHILEFLLARPITRSELLLTKYFGIGIGSVIAMLIAIGITLPISLVVFKLLLSPVALAILTLTIIAEIFAILGFFILIAQLVPTSSLYLGISVGLWIFFKFFYLTFIFLVYVNFQNNLLLVILNYLNIFNYYGLVGNILNAVPPYLTTVGSDPMLLIICLIAWIVLPALIAVQLARKRD